MQKIDDHTLALVVEDRKAIYPLYIDPIIQFKNLVADDAEDWKYFGICVAIYGDTVVIGADWDDLDMKVDAGSVYIFQRDQGGSDNWGQVKKNTMDNGMQDDRFGFSIAINGNTAVIGVPFDDVDMAVNAGSAFVYDRDQGGTNNWGLVSELTPTVSLQSGDMFGYSVAISGDMVVIGAPHDDVDMAVDAGAAYVFRRDQGGTDNWGEMDKLIASDWGADDHLGASVSISGNTIVAGAPGNNDLGPGSGSAYVFKYARRPPPPITMIWEWQEKKKLLPVGGTGGEKFGSSVAIDGENIVVGAYGDGPGMVWGAGSAFIFQRNRGGTDKWGLAKKIVAVDGEMSDAFGRAVAINSDTIVVGAPIDKDMGHDSGSAYVFQRNHGGPDNWGQSRKILAADGSGGDNFGESIDASGKLIIVGAAFRYGENGSAYLFEIKNSHLWFPVRAANGKTVIIGM